MTRPTNLYSQHIASILQYSAFEEGVDAGRKWGHEEKDEEWRERIHKLHMAHWPVSDYSTDPSGLVHWFVEELLSGRDIE